MITDTLISLGKNPNLGAVLIVSLGCEGTDAGRIEKELSEFGKRVKKIVSQEIGGSFKAVRLGSEIAADLAQNISSCKREKVDISNITLGIKCGSSDATSGISSNPATGVAADMIVKNGGSAVFGEITEFIGAEHILARRASDEKVSKRIYEIVNDMEVRAKSMGVDMRKGQPTPGNIAGGLTTIEEKSLGAISKGGSCKINDILEYPDFLNNRKGLFVKDTPGREPDALTGFVAAGAQILVFTTGRGAPQGHPIAPVIKVCGNPKTCKNLASHIDVDISSMLTGDTTTKEGGEKIFQKILTVASGEKTKAEINRYNETMEIWVKGPII
jgi:altronate dehydratase large subunit